MQLAYARRKNVYINDGRTRLFRVVFWSCFAGLNGFIGFRPNRGNLNRLADRQIANTDCRFHAPVAKSGIKF